jgi:hypothetical protein
LKDVKFTGLPSVIWKFGGEATGVTAVMMVGLDGGGLSAVYGIFTLNE